MAKPVVKEEPFNEKDRSDYVDPETGEVGAVAKIEEAFNAPYVPVNFEDAMRWAAEHEGGIVEFQGSPYTVLDRKDKRLLCDLPFVIVEMKDFDPQKNPTVKFKGKEGFVSLAVVTQHPITINGRQTDKVVIVDGGTGIRNQVRSWLSQYPERTGGMYCPKGLRVSEYEYEDAEGNTSDAETYYIN